MLNYSRFYKAFGNRKVQHLIKPKITKDSDFVFPIKSMLIWSEPSDTPAGPNASYTYLKNIKSPVVKTMIEYVGDTIGSFRVNTKVKPFTVFKALRKSAPGFRYLNLSINNFRVAPTAVMIINTGAVNALHYYNNYPLTTYWKWYNDFATNVNLLTNKHNQSLRSKFINIKVPFNIPSRIVLEKYTSRDVNKMILEKLTPNDDVLIGYEELTILDLWKFLTPSSRDKSVLNNIPVDELNNINLIFTIDNKITVMNLGLLTSLVEDYNMETKLNKFPSKVVRKLFYIFLSRFISNPVIDIGEAENSDTKDIATNNKEEEDITSADLDSILDNELTIPKEEEAEEDTLTETIDTITREQDIEDVVEDEDVDKYDNIKEASTVDQNKNKTLVDKVDELKKNKVITKQKQDRITKILDDQESVTVNIPGVGEVPLKELRTISNEELALTDTDSKINSTSLTNDPALLKDVVSAYDAKYIDNTYHKDIANVLYSIQDRNMVVSNYTVTKNENNLGVTEEHTITITPLQGNPVTIRVILPVVSKDGELKLSGNKYKIRKQRADIPIRKIGYNEVVLGSYYGKLFITKATYKKDDIGFWIRKQFISNYGVDEKLKDLILIGVNNVGAVVPIVYGNISRYIKSFKYENNLYYFEYSTRKKILSTLTNEILASLEKSGSVLIGVQDGKHPLLINSKNEIVSVIDNKEKVLGNIYDLINLNLDRAPLEYVNVKVFKEYIPIVVILSYYLGLTQLMKLLKCKYRTVEAGKRVVTTKDEFVVTFKDIKYIITKDYDVGDLILGGLISLDKLNKTTSHKVWNKKTLFTAILHNMGLPMLYVNELSMLDDMFIDPITESILEELKEPTTFKGLLFRSVELLADDNYTNPNSMDKVIIRGYERIPGMLYSEMVKALREQNNKSAFSKASVTLNPYIILNKIGNDSTTVLVDDINPIASLKQSEDVSMLGEGGRSKVGVNEAARVVNSEDIGIVSEATKDAGDVGITAYLTANPKIESTRGVLGKYDPEKDGMETTMSTTALLYPASHQDDIKRSNFANVQSSHVIPIVGAVVTPVCTGYEEVISYKVSDKFAIHAAENGVVTNIKKDVLEVKYRPAKGDAYTKKYPIKEWSTKEESGSCYVYKLISNVELNDKFSQGDALLYANEFFEPSIFNNRRLVFKSATLLRTALTEENETYEDSCAISKKITDKLATRVTKVKSFVIKSSDEIINMVAINQKLKANDSLFSITDSATMSLSGLTDEAIEALKRLKQATPKSKYNGVINKIVIYYNEDITELSTTLQELVKVSDKNIARDTGKKFTGRVDNSYSIQGKPLLSGQVEIKIYITIEESMGVGDKGIFANQLKSTVGDVYEYDLKTVDGRDVDAKFSTKSISARIVNSPYIIGTTGTVLNILAENACKEYF